MPITEVDSGALSGVELESKRLRLRWLEPGDAEAVETLIGDWDVARNLAQVPYPYPKGLASRWIAGIRAGGFLRGELVFAVTRRSDDLFLGVVALILTDDRLGAEVGYWFGKPFWGQGYATEAVASVIDFARSRMGVRRMWGACLIENLASAHVLEKSGMTFESEGDLYFVSQGGSQKVHYYGRSLTDDDPGRTADTVDPPLPLVLVAAVALFDVDGRVLLARRPTGKSMAGLWEFPGGKVHDAETPECALIRELREELGIDVSASCLAPFTFASHRYEKFHLLMPLYVCRVWKGTPKPLEGQDLTWVRVSRLGDYEMPPADKPLIAMLRDLL